MKDLYRQVTRHLEVLNVKAEMEEPGMLGFESTWNIP